MAQPRRTRGDSPSEEAITVLFCLVDDAYRPLNPRWRSYEPLKRLPDSGVIALALFRQLRGVESERSFLRDAQRFFSHLFSGVVGLAPSSLHRRLRGLRRFPEPLRRAVLPDLVGGPQPPDERPADLPRSRTGCATAHGCVPSRGFLCHARRLRGMRLPDVA